MMGAAKVALAYVGCAEIKSATYEFEDEEEEHMYQMLLNGKLQA